MYLVSLCVSKKNKDGSNSDIFNTVLTVSNKVNFNVSFDKDLISNMKRKVNKLLPKNS